MYLYLRLHCCWWVSYGSAVQWRTMTATPDSHSSRQRMDNFHRRGTFSCASLQGDPRPSPLAFFPLLSLAGRVWRPLLPLPEVWGMGQGHGQGAPLGWAHPAGQSAWPPRPSCSAGTCHPLGHSVPFSGIYCIQGPPCPQLSGWP